MGQKAWLSPLRYPGAQRRLLPYIRTTIQKNNLKPQLFIEPFAGGASVALQLLGEGVVQRIALADKDSLVTAFWKTVFNEPEWLVSKVQQAEPSLEQWTEYKDLVKSDELTVRERAFVCLYLNRTSFSGILHPQAGPLGGYKQESEHTIDCRFPKEVLTGRIHRLGELRDRVEFIWNKSWRGTFSLVEQMQNRGSLPADIFYYLDPPFFKKSQKLYIHSFDNSDHETLRDKLSVMSTDWFLSYDDCAEVWDHYGGLGLNGGSLDFIYGPSGNGVPSENGRNIYSEAIVSNLDALPSEVLLWQKPGRRGLAQLN